MRVSEKYKELFNMVIPGEVEESKNLIICTVYRSLQSRDDKMLNLNIFPTPPSIA